MRRLLLLLLVVLLAVAACGNDPALEPGDDPADTDTGETAEEYDVGAQPADAQPTFASPADGDAVPSPVRVEMTATGVEIVPAGDPAVGQGHFHVTVDAGCIEAGQVVPGPGEEAEADGYYHFGDGASEGELPISPGTHELCLQLADGAHQVFGGSDVIIVIVE